MNTMNTKKRWIVLAIAAVFLCSVAAILFRITNVPSAGCYAYIYKDGTLIRTIDLQESLSLTFTIEGENGAFNTIEVKNGAIRVTKASCPDLICVHQGAIRNDLLPITCLPNQLVIAISQESSTDITAY